MVTLTDTLGAVATLEPFAPDVYTVTRDLRFYGVETGARMSVVQMSNGGLFVHSPGPLDDELRGQLDALGEVAAIVAPSSFHHLHVLEWQAAFPDAKLGCNPALENKRSDVVFDVVMGDEPEPEWRGELEQVHFSARTLEDEVVFFHPRSRTLICCDAIFNLRHHHAPLTRLAAISLANIRPGATWLERLMMRRHRQAGRAQVDRMLAWDIDKIVLSHGPLIESDGHEVVRQAYAWL